MPGSGSSNGSGNGSGSGTQDHPSARPPLAGSKLGRAHLRLTM
jgi:hypothetical protein